jgi:hypothetical protein
MTHSGDSQSNRIFPAMHSLLSNHALKAWMSEVYDVGEIQNCHLLTHGLNDTSGLGNRSHQ